MVVHFYFGYMYKEYKILYKFATGVHKNDQYVFFVTLCWKRLITKILIFIIIWLFAHCLIGFRVNFKVYMYLIYRFKFLKNKIKLKSQSVKMRKYESEIMLCVIAEVIITHIHTYVHRVHYWSWIEVVQIGKLISVALQEPIKTTEEALNPKKVTLVVFMNAEEELDQWYNLYTKGEYRYELCIKLCLRSLLKKGYHCLKHGIKKRQ